MRRMISDALFAKIKKIPMFVHLVGIYDPDCNIYVYGKSTSNEPIKTYQDLFAQLGDRVMLAVGKLRVDGVLVDACALDTYGRKISSAKFRFTNAEGKIGDIIIQNIAPNATFEDAVYME